MPAITVENPLVLPRLDLPAPESVHRQVDQVVSAHHTFEGAGFEVWRPFPGLIGSHVVDPFFLLDQLGPVEYAPNEAVGAPWHPHRGFETVTYVIDGVVEHHDSNGGGGVIGEGATQWMTAGAGILHDEVPTEVFKRNGGRTHGVQLWVNLPSSLKFTPARYQAITADELGSGRTTAGRWCGSSPATWPATPAPGPPTLRSCTRTRAEPGCPARAAVEPGLQRARVRPER